MTDSDVIATAVGITDPVMRDAYLRQTCPDPDQRGRVERRLADRRAAPPPAGRADSPDAPTAQFHRGRPVSDAESNPAPFLAPPQRPGSIGRLGHYEVLEILGQGGFGIVFRAFDETLQRVVAIKVLAPAMAATSPARKRFLREARAAAKVRHESVVQIYAIEETPIPYLVMEFIPGETLQTRIDRNGPVDAAEVAKIGAQIARGLAAAHELGMVHRDVKPDNVLLEHGPEEKVKLTDFGLARTADDARITRSGFVAGTPLYMAPEQARGEACDPRADLFSLGSVLYTLLTGRPPFRAEGALAILKRVCDDTPRPIQELIPETPNWICRVVERLHAKNPDDRIPTARAVAEMLASRQPPPPFKPSSSRSRVPRPEAAVPEAPPARRWLWVAGGVAGAALLASGVLLGGRFFPRPDAPAATPPAATAPAVTAPARAPAPAPDGEWGPPEKLGPGVNTPRRDAGGREVGGRDLSPTLTADEQQIAFERDQRVWLARWDGNSFGRAEALPDGAAAGPRENPTLTGDGLELVFVARGPGDEHVIHACRRATPDAPFGPPEPLPGPVNGRGWVRAPVLSADGLTLLVTRVWPGGAGGGDVVMYTRPTRTDVFDSPAMFPEPINTAAYDVACWVSDDRRTLVRTQMAQPPAQTRAFALRPDGTPADAGRPVAVPGVVGEVGRPWLSPDGLRMYFHTRAGPDGAADLDIWLTRRGPRKSGNP